jgi:UDP-N-acetylmuramoyl-tripeptide--D-alanyl-D-alanine ligase
MRYLIALLWFVIFAKKLLFWTYLWQLKEYHIGRFLDHFRTAKGKSLVLSPFLAFKIVLLSGLYLTATKGFSQIKLGITYLIVLVFFLEGVLFIKNFLQKTFKKPVLTRKTAVIISSGLSLGFLIIFFVFLLEFRLTKFTFSLLTFDVLAPLILSGFVLVFQPLAVILRNRLIGQAQRKRAQFKNLKVVGITGSYGKTSTKEFLAEILSAKYRVLKTKEHQNSEMGIAKCILQDLKPEHEIFVCEMGAYNKGGIKLLCNIVRPQVGILTGINEQHMSTFGSQENIIKTKYELIESLPKDGIAFFNVQNKYCADLYNKTIIKKFLYGQEASFSGEENILGAMAAARELGMSREEVLAAAGKIKNRMGGVKLKKGFGGVNVIDATFSANPDGVLANLEYLKTFPGKKAIIMPCLIELGSASREVHLKIGKKIGEVCDLAIITTKDRIAELKQGAAGRGNIIYMENSQEIEKKLKEVIKSGDTILLESRVSPQVIEKLI